jgi:hypothetical protein
MEIYEHPNPFALEQDDCGNGPLCFHYDQGELEGGRDARVAMEIGFLILVCQLLFAKSGKNYFQPAAPASPVSAAKPVDRQ